MKIGIVSDLHLEVHGVNLVYDEKPDVLILSGDICLIRDLLSTSDEGVYAQGFFANLSEEFENVVYVAGNHELWHGTWCGSIAKLRMYCAALGNVHFLERDIWTKDDVTFIGASLWTDFNNRDPLTLLHAESAMRDYERIKNDAPDARSWKLKPSHSLFRHIDSKEYINLMARHHFRDSKVVVATHHAPTPMSIHPYYSGDSLMNGAYHSDLSELILDNPNIALWTHGHVHSEHDYMVGNTRVVCNPRGYFGYEVSDVNFKVKVVEV